MNPVEIRELNLDGDYVAAARLVAEYGHAGQVDKQDVAYIEHVRAVAELVDSFGLDQQTIAAAWLHDVVEDTDIRLKDLTELGFPWPVINTVDHLTRRDGEMYPAFIERVTESSRASVVKRADLMHNSDERRGPIPDSLKARYSAALDRLGGPLEEKP